MEFWAYAFGFGTVPGRHTIAAHSSVEFMVDPQHMWAVCGSKLDRAPFVVGIHFEVVRYEDSEHRHRRERFGHFIVRLVNWLSFTLHHDFSDLYRGLTWSDPANQWSRTKWVEGNAHEVEIVDYH
jgi:hypothetical protein